MANPPKTLEYETRSTLPVAPPFFTQTLRTELVFKALSELGVYANNISFHT